MARFRIDDAVRETFAQAHFCWFATADTDALPCVAPKEVFTVHGDTILLADATTTTCFENVSRNPRACITVMNRETLVGYKLDAEIRTVAPDDPGYPALAEVLQAVVKPDFPFGTIYEARPFAQAAVPIPVVRAHTHRTHGEMMEERWDDHHS